MSDESTGKKKKLTLKGRTLNVAEEGDATADGPIPEVRTRGKLVVNTAYHKLAAIIAIITSVIFLALIAVQLFEWAYYQQPPNVWPLKLVVPGAP